MPEAGVMTIDDLLKNKAGLAGPAQESLATQKLRSQKSEVRSKNLELRNQKSKIPASSAGGQNLKSNMSPTPFRDIPTKSQNAEAENIPNTRYQIPNTEEAEAGMSLREQVLAAKQEEAKKNSSREAASRSEEGEKAKSLGTGTLLKWAWLNLIPTWGLSLIYINTHVFLKQILGEKFFCKLGEEWMPKQISEVAGEGGKIAGKTAGIAEIMVLIILDIIAGAVIIGILSLIVMMATWMDMSWWGKSTTIFKAIWDLGFDGFTALANLFGGLAL
jgi:hypothetical protein